MKGGCLLRIVQNLILQVVVIKERMEKSYFYVKNILNFDDGYENKSDI